MSATVLMSESLSSEGSTDNGYLRIKRGAIYENKIEAPMIYFAIQTTNFR